MEIMIGERRIEVPQEEADRLVKSYGKSSPGLKYGDKYWIISSGGEVISSTWLDDSDDRKRTDFGNVYTDREWAQSHLDWLEAVAEIKRSSDFVPDWESHGQSKYFVFYDHQNGKLCVEYFDYYQNQSIVHYATRLEAEQAITAHRDAYLTYFGIKNTMGGLQDD